MTLVVTRALGLVTIQDLGRPGRMHEALAPGGALVPELLVAANRAAHNPDSAAALEVCGQLVVRAETTVVVASDAITIGASQLAARRAHTLNPGDELALASDPRRVTYLAVRGGIDAPVVLGGRATQLSAGLGAALRAGSRLDPGDAPVTRTSAGAPFVDGELVRVVPGPDLDAFAADALARLVGAPYRVLPTSDRVGTRLDGAPIPRAPGHTDRSRPMVRGAIEVPPDGAPIVLGPEHPTTGGYPIIAVVAHSDLARFFAIRLGGTVRFTA